jgi:CBS domain-containing protein
MLDLLRHMNFGPGLRVVRDDEVRVSDLVAHDPISVSPETSLVRAATVMVSSSIRHLPVVEEGRLLGMLDSSDACRALVALRNIPDGAVATAAVV